MTDVRATTLSEIEAFARRHGLTNLAPEHLKRLAEITDTVSAVGRGLPRMSSKEDEPAHTFRVPQL
jgi:aspartyl-tRNA(Asn)/glutamyl-tRNA(Gln) amidotransferase subunit A